MRAAQFTAPGNMAPSEPRTLQVRVLTRAAEILGGRPNLCRHLGISTTLLALWIGGLEPPPTSYFLKAVDVIEAERMADLKKPGAD
jgi:hypothetical protein